MSSRPNSWYLRGQDNQPTGPFTEDELVQFWHAGRLDESTIGWCEGMAEWLALRQLEPFASLMRTRDVPTAAAPETLAILLPPGTERRLRKRRHAAGKWIGWAIGGAVAAVCAVGAVVFLHLGYSDGLAGNAAKLVGTWEHDAGLVTLKVTYSKAHTYAATLVGSANGSETGAWSLQGDCLTQKATHSTIDAENVGKEDVVTIVKLDDSVLIFRSRDRNEHDETMAFERVRGVPAKQYVAHDPDQTPITLPDRPPTPPLRISVPPVVVRPPDDSQEKAEKALYESRIAEAEKAAVLGHWQVVADAISRASATFPLLYQSDVRAKELGEIARFALAVGQAKDLVTGGNLDAALIAENNALRIRPADKDAGDLRGQICRLRAEELEKNGRKAFDAGDYVKAVALLRDALQVAPDDIRLQRSLDRARIEECRSKAEQEDLANDLRNAAEDVTRARQILDNRASEEFSVPLRKSVEALSESLLGKLRDRVKALNSQRQYPDARELVQLGLRLSSKDQDLLNLRQEIEKLAADPNTANISGTWTLANGARCDLTDTGADTIRYQAGRLPKDILSCLGEWKRKGDKLAGSFQVFFAVAPGQKTEGEVNATIKDPSTLAVCWQEITKPKKSSDGKWTWRGKGEGLWTKVESAAAALPADNNAHRGGTDELENSASSTDKHARSGLDRRGRMHLGK